MNTTDRAINMLTSALADIGVTATVVPASPVSSFDGAECEIGTSTFNLFLDESLVPARWRAEVTYEDASYNEFDIDDDASLRHLLRQLT